MIHKFYQLFFLLLLNSAVTVQSYIDQALKEEEKNNLLALGRGCQNYHEDIKQEIILRLEKLEDTCYKKEIQNFLKDFLDELDKTRWECQIILDQYVNGKLNSYRIMNKSAENQTRCDQLKRVILHYMRTHNLEN